MMSASSLPHLIGVLPGFLDLPTSFVEDDLGFVAAGDRLAGVPSPVERCSRVDRVTESAEVVEPHIGTLNEGSLHAALKELYAEAGDRFEVPLDRFVIDIARADLDGQLLIEIQTGSFGAMGRKLDFLLPDHQILLVHPIAHASYLCRDDAKPRRSPKKGSVYDLFGQLVSIPTLLDHPNLTLDIVMVNVDKVQEHDPKARRGRGGYRTVDRRLREVIERHRFESPTDLLRLVPDELPDIFTTADLARLGGFSRSHAQQMAYCFRALDFFEEIDRTRAGYRYRLGPGTV